MGSLFITQLMELCYHPSHLANHGNYTISVEIAAELFIPIGPVYANFSAAVSLLQTGPLKLNYQLRYTKLLTLSDSYFIPKKAK
jgi:hypothetical protein